MNDEFWTTMREYYAGLLGVGESTLVYAAAGLALLVTFLVFALNRRCSRCGTWFSGQPVDYASAGMRRGRFLVRTTYRCQTCGNEWSTTRSQRLP